MSAFGDFDKRKSSTPGAARVRSVSALVLLGDSKNKCLPRMELVAVLMFWQMKLKKVSSS